MSRRSRFAFSFALAVVFLANDAPTGSPLAWAGVTEEDYFPIFFNRTIADSSGAHVEEDWVWPFGRFDRNDEKRKWAGALRPILSWGGDFEDERFYRILPPLGLFNRSSRVVDYRIQPLWYYSCESLGDGEESWSNRLFPFFTIDNDREEPSVNYSLLYGHTFNRFGVDELEYWLFPLALKTRSRDFVNWSLLVPFLGYGYGGKGSNVRFWPFYGHQVVPGQKATKFIAWPFYGHQLAYDEEGDLVETWGCLPLYVKIDSPRRTGWSFLWPFFEKSHVDSPRRRYEKLSAPYPFYHEVQDTRLDKDGKRNGGENTRTYFPFYGHVDKEDRARRLDAECWTPLLWRIDREKAGKYASSQRIFFPFVWLKTTRWSTTLKTAHGLKLWPFFNYEESERGGHHLRVFDPFWLRRERDMDRHYSVLYTVYERERDERGYGFDQILGKAMYACRYADYSRTNILHLIQAFDTPDLGRGWSIARGLVGKSTSDWGTRWKLFWLTIGE